MPVRIGVIGVDDPLRLVAYRRELQDWVDGVAAGDPARGASAWDGYAATVVAAAGVRALDSGLPQSVSLRDRPELYR